MSKAISRWIKLPLWWIHDGAPERDEWSAESFLNVGPTPGLKEFTQRNRGNSIAALKLYIALLVKTNNKSTAPEYGESTLSITEIQKSTGLSREKIVSASRMLETYDLIEAKRKNGAKNTYRIVGYERTPWGKLPKSMFLLMFDDGDTLKQISTRSKVGLNALKLYLFLAASVDQKTGYANRTYDTITKNTGIIRNEIKRGLSLLINLKLIVIEHEKPEGISNPYNFPNHYYIRGIGGKY